MLDYCPTVVACFHSENIYCLYITFEHLYSVCRQVCVIVLGCFYTVCSGCKRNVLYARRESSVCGCLHEVIVGVWCFQWAVAWDLFGVVWGLLRTSCLKCKHLLSFRSLCTISLSLALSACFPSSLYLFFSICATFPTVFLCVEILQCIDESQCVDQH